MSLVTTKLPIVPGHVWLDNYTLMPAPLRSGGIAEISKQFSAGTSPSEFVTPVPCADLSLQQAYFNKPNPSGDPVYVRPERTPIYESAECCNVVIPCAG